MKVDLIIGKHLSMLGKTWLCEFIFAIANFMESNTDQEFWIQIYGID